MKSVANIDWAATRLGAIADWPASLATAAAIVMRSPGPKLLIWGVDNIAIYNDAYASTRPPSDTCGQGMPYPEQCPVDWEVIRTGVLKAREDGCSSEPGSGQNGALLASYTLVPAAGGCEEGVLVERFDASGSRAVLPNGHSDSFSLQRLFSETPVFIGYVVLPDLRFEFANRAFERLYCNREIIGRTVAEALPEAAEQGFDTILEHVIATGEHWAGHDTPIAIGDPGTGEAKVKHVDFIYQAVRSDEGEMIGIACSGYDVSERHRSQADAERLRHQLQHASRINAMGTVAMTLAHELNQPLAAAANLVAAARKLILSDAQPAEMPLSALLTAEQQIVRAGDIIRRVRTVVKSGRADRVPVSIQTVLDSASALLDTDGVGGLLVTSRIGANASHVLADPIQLEQMLFNLLRNACHASRDAPRKEAVVTSERISPKRISVTVTDFGAGLAPEQLANILAGHAMLDGDGLGIGLPLTRTLVEANGGTLTAANADPIGAAFRLTLEAVPDSASAVGREG